MKYYLIILIIFLLSPLLGILLSLVVLFKIEKPKKETYYILFILLSLWLSGINATKEFASDQIGYAEMYMNSKQFSFFNALTELKASAGYGSGGSWNEFLYNAITWCGYYLTFGNAPLFCKCSN